MTLKFSEWNQLLEEFEAIPKTQFGSNSGGKFKDKEKGTEHYIKFPNSPEQTKVEVATAKIYEKLGIQTVKPELENSISGRIGVRSEWNPNLETISPDAHHDHIERNPAYRRKILDIYHAAAITGNLDVVGLATDNIVRDKNTGMPVSIDQGGSMHYRAQGGSKEFSHNPMDHLTGMLKTSRPSGVIFSHAFKHASNDEISASKEHMKSLSDSDIDDIIDSTGLDKSLGDTIKARRNFIAKGASK